MQQENLILVFPDKKKKLQTFVDVYPYLYRLQKPPYSTVVIDDNVFKKLRLDKLLHVYILKR